jgi:hypothetical protein
VQSVVVGEIQMISLPESDFGSNWSALLYYSLLTLWIAFTAFAFQRVRTTVNPTILLLFSLWILWGFGYETVGKRLMLQVDGTVLSKRDMPYPIAPNRYSTEYLVQRRDGTNQIFVAGPTDASLPRNIAVGTTLRKLRWHVNYESDGYWVNDFSVPFYSAILFAGVIGLGLSLKDLLMQK